MSKTRLGACLMVAVSMSALACDDERLGGCSLVGCPNLLRIELAPPATLPYEVTLGFPDGQIVSFPCDDEKIHYAGDNLFLVTCKADGFEVLCVPDPGYCASPSLSVQVKLPDGTRRSAALTLDQHLVQPNGPECEPTCAQGLATLQ